MPDDLEWPRRALVGAIVVIGVAGLGTSTAVNAGVIRLDYSLKSQTIALSSIHRQTPDYHSSIQSAKLRQHKMRLQTSRREGRFAVDKVRRLRAMSSLCRQQAAYNSMNKWKLLAEAEYWDHLADLELSAHFQQCNAAGSNEIAPPQAITNTDETRQGTSSAA